MREITCTLSLSSRTRGTDAIDLAAIAKVIISNKGARSHMPEPIYYNLQRASRTHRQLTSSQSATRQYHHLHRGQDIHWPVESKRLHSPRARGQASLTSGEKHLCSSLRTIPRHSRQPGWASSVWLPSSESMTPSWEWTLLRRSSSWLRSPQPDHWK